MYGQTQQLKSNFDLIIETNAEHEYYFPAAAPKFIFRCIVSQAAASQMALGTWIHTSMIPSTNVSCEQQPKLVFLMHHQETSIYFSNKIAHYRLSLHNSSPAFQFSTCVHWETTEHNQNAYNIFHARSHMPYLASMMK